MIDPNNPFADLIPSTKAPPSVIMGPPKSAPLPTPRDPDVVEGTRLENEKRRRELQGLNPDGTPKEAAGTKLRDLPTQAAGGIQEDLKSLRQIDVALEALKSRPESVGPGTGMLGKYFTNWNDPEGTSTRAAVAAIGATKIHDLSGAAVSPTEAPRFMPFVPQADDTPKAAHDKLIGFRKELEASLREKFDYYGPANNYKPYSTPEAQAFLSGKMAAPVVPDAPKQEGDIGFSGKEMVGDRLLSPEKEKLWTTYLNSVRGKADPAELSATWKELTGEQLLTPEKVAASVNAQKGPFGTAIAYEDRPEDRVNAEKLVREQDARSLGGPESNTGVMLKHGATLGFDDEVSGLGYAAGSLLRGKNPLTAYQIGRDAQRIRIERARGDLGGFGTGIEIAGGLLSANPEAAVTAASGGIRSLIGQGARQGAQVGALAGFGSGEGAADSTGKAVVGGVLGGALGATVSGASGALAARRLAQAGQAPDLAAAADAEGVNLVRPMFNDQAAQRLSALEAQPGSGPIVRQGLDQVEGQIEGRVANLGAGGNVMETGAAGDVVQGAARRFIDRSRGVANRLYSRAEQLAGGQGVTPRDSLAQLRRELTDLRETPNVNQGEIDFINELGNDLTNGPLSVDAIKGLRASVRGRIAEKNLTHTQVEARAMRIIDSLNTDAQASLPPAAANAYRRADAYYRERMVHIDDILDRFLGGNKNGVPRVSGEQAFARLKSMASPGGDGRRLAGMMRSLDGQERLDIAATVAESLGRRAPDAPFTADNFLTHTAKLSPSSRRTIFGPDGAQSIENLRTLSRALQQARSGVNRSNSARSFWQDTGRTVAGALMFGGSGAAAGGAGTGAIAAASVVGASLAKSGIRTLSARALMSPRMSRWLAELPSVASQAQAEAAARRLGSIAAREPAIAGELQPLQRWLSQSPAASAEPQTEDQQNGR